MEESFDTLARLSRAGLDRLIARGTLTLDRALYEARIERELSVIRDLDEKKRRAPGSGTWSEFLLFTADYANAARERGVYVGPGRGSAAASVVCLCIGITTGIDPLRYRLIFERFLNVSRVSSPDIDLDFSDQNVVIDYLEERYGLNRVVRISAPQYMKAKSALREVGMVLNIPFSEGIALGKAFDRADEQHQLFREFKDVDPKYLDRALELSDEMKEFAARYPRLFPLARRFVGVLRNHSTHPAGVLVLMRPAGAEVPLMRVGGVTVGIRTAWDCKALESLGYVKADVLSVSNFQIIGETIQMVKARHGVTVVPEDIPHDDSRARDLFRSGRMIGTFQLGDNPVAKQMAVEMVDTMEDVALINAAIRPGIEWQKIVEHKKDPLDVYYPIEGLKNILGDSYGVFVYQEQIMFAVRDLAGFTMEEADQVRRVVATTSNAALQYDIDTYRDRFIQGCEEKGHSNAAAQAVWQQIKALANYCFNKTIHEDELVRTGRGDLPIKDVRPGDFVPAIEAVDGKLVWTGVVALHDHGVVPLVEVEFDGGETIRCTRDHKFDTPEGVLPIHEVQARGLRVRCYEPFSKARAVSQAVLLEGHRGAQKDATGGHAPSASTSRLPEGDVRGCQADFCTTGDHGGESSKARAVEGGESSQVRGDQSGGRCCHAEREGAGCAENRVETLASKEPGSVLRDDARLARSSEALEVGSRSRTCCSAARVVAERDFHASVYEAEAGGFRLEVHDYVGGVGRPASLPSDLRGGEAGADSSEGREVQPAHRWIADDSLDPSLNGDVRRSFTAQVPAARPDSRGQLCASDDGRVVLRRVVRIRDVGFGRGFDLEVEHQRHTFLMANGLSSSNSHALAYGLTAWHEAYLKARWPAEYLCACINDVVRKGKREEYEKFVAEAKRFGVTVLAPGVNRSRGESFVNAEGAIVLGLKMLKHVGGVADHVPKHAPYNSWSDFCERSKAVSADVKAGSAGELFAGSQIVMPLQVDQTTASLIHGGAFDALHSRGDMLRALYPDTNITTTFAATLEYEALGFFLVANPLADFASDMAGWIETSEDRRRTGTIGGVVLSVRTSAKGHGFLTIRTLSATVELVCWADEWEDASGEVKIGMVVCGKAFKTKRGNYAISEIGEIVPDKASSTV